MPRKSGSSHGTEASVHNVNQAEAARSGTVEATSTANNVTTVRRRPTVNTPLAAGSVDDGSTSDESAHDLHYGTEWRNAEGENLEDFGVEKVNDHVP